MGRREEELCFSLPYSAPIDLCWHHIDFYHNSTELLIHIQLVAIPSLSLVYLFTLAFPHHEFVVPDHFPKVDRAVLALLGSL